MDQRDEALQYKLDYIVENIINQVDKTINSKRDSFEPSTWDSNAIGIFGPRGSGKTTVLEKTKLFFKHKVHIQVLSPLDCTQVPPHIHPGCAVLLHIFREFDKDMSNKTQEWQRFQNELLHLSQGYSSSSSEFGNLCLDLSGSTKEFAEYQTQGLMERLSLRENLQTIIDAFSKDSGIKALLLPLDDFDLVEKDHAIDWTNALLDDLHQPRLIFLVAADFHRLQGHLIEKKGFDDITSRAILNKLLPPDNRLDLPAWSFEEINKYPGKIHSHQREADTAKGQHPPPNNLKKYLDSYLNAIELSMNLIYGLLPRKPRGVRNLYDAFQMDETLFTKITNPQIKPQKNAKQLLTWIATSREETLLARSIREHHLVEWLKILDPSIKNSEHWEENVDLAKGRICNSIETLQPLNDLLPKDVKIPQEKNEGRTPTQMTHPPDWGYPQIQKQQRDFSLRDAEPDSIALWTEVLLDLSFKIPEDETPSERDGIYKAVRNRIRFFTHWGPIAHRQDSAQFTISTELTTVQQFFNSASLKPIKAGLLWIQPAKDNAQKFKIGWGPLLKKLGGIEDPLLHNWRHKLVVSEQPLSGSLPELGAVETLSLIPDQIWAMILLTDGLARCPWLSISRPSGWLLQAHLALAAGLVRTAYVYAMKQSNCIDVSILSETQKSLITMLRLRDPEDLISSGETKLIHRMNDLFHDDLESELKDKSDSLSQAFKSYLNSEPYKAVVEMTNQVIRVWELKKRRVKRLT